MMKDHCPKLIKNPSILTTPSVKGEHAVSLGCIAAWLVRTPWGRAHHLIMAYIVYASIWLFAKVIVIIAVLIGAYFSFRETIAQQAIKSREFLPAQFHYGPAGLRDDTKNASDAVRILCRVGLMTNDDHD